MPRPSLPTLSFALLALCAAALAESSETPGGPALFLRDGRVIECVEAPVIAFGRAVYTTKDGARHSTSLELVDVEKTRAHAMGRTGQRALRRQTASSAGRREAPDFTLTRPDGAELELSALEGKVVLIDFWATWCGPCISALPELLAVHRRYTGPDFQVVGVSLDSDRKRFESFVRERGMDFPQHFDGKKWENEVARLYGVRSIPRTVLLDRSGRIAHVNAKGPALHAAIEALLAEEQESTDL